MSATRVIERGWLGRIDPAELWRYRDLVFQLARRDLQLRYRQTLFGVAWAILQPVATMAVLSVVFDRFAKIPSDGFPYPLFAFAALVPWQLFALALSQASNSTVANPSLITKVYFPRVLIPAASVLSGMPEFAVSFVVLVALMLWYGVHPSLAILAVPLLALLAVVAALAVGLWLSALNVRYRDVRYAIPFLLQLWLLATPIAYPVILVPERWRLFVFLNPLAGIVQGFRWAVLGDGAFPATMLAVSLGASLVVLVSGLWFFQRLQRSFADEV